MISPELNWEGGTFPSLFLGSELDFLLFQGNKGLGWLSTFTGLGYNIRKKGIVPLNSIFILCWCVKIEESFPEGFRSEKKEYIP